MSEQDALKRAAAERALEEVRDGMKVGLGTGSTMTFFIEALGAALASGRLRDIRGVPTSEATARQAAALKIPLLDLDEGCRLDLGIDGADEITNDLNLVKGLGGALLREKMVASSCSRFLVVADASKRVPRLCVRSPLPVEVTEFGWRWHLGFLQELGARPVLRVSSMGIPFRTDGGNLILDAHFPGGVEDPEPLQRALRERPGIVESGLFLRLCDGAVITRENGTELMGDLAP